MKAVVDIIESGLLELYVLNLLEGDELAQIENLRLNSSEVNDEINKIELFFEQHALQHSVPVSINTELKLQNLFHQLSSTGELNISNLPLIDENANYQDWFNLVENLIPINGVDGTFTHLLTGNEKVMQMLVVSEIDIKKEIHENELESFLILEGSCICTIDNSDFSMGPGDYMSIPLHKSHTVKITSLSVTAILQHVAL
ncbi:cupin domain-containing protein [Pedobacter jejuensis]|uniref:Cupin domain-containing protein n=1 Tax=Pedobacter jejuensis TaxID=1268550 RepID=A0A3N0BSV4_9SPHI|nr:cupin domain-containing protein [Pedobacter jejuensis]RNL52161.1 cupin domain-containing protein [Pedobacter jejuensis]